jgi:polysaccharide deacetylase 2 family uncharacterized protein YibQ
MVKKPAIIKKKTKKRTSNKRGSRKTNYKKGVTGVLLLALLVVIVALFAHYLMPCKQVAQPVKKASIDKKTVSEIPVFEIYPKEDKPVRKPVLRPKPLLPDQLPRVSIIIDDIGYERVIADKFLSLDAVLTFSVFPHSPFQKAFVKKAAAKGHEIMLHLPMEPNGFPEIDPGPGALLTSMSPDELICQLNENLDAIPSIKGVNNHMGSKMTSVSTQMYQIFSVLKKRGLFFIDSCTTSATLCKPSARLLQIPFAQRDVFLDHIPEPDFIRKQIKELINIAISHGEAIGIAHPHSVTYEVLREELPELQKKVRLVPASSLVKIIE